MKAVRLEGGRVALVDRPVPVPRPGWALVRVEIAGLCGTDAELAAGYYDFRGTPGHEFVGIVVAAPGNAPWEGRRVAADINVGCGSCDRCRAGNQRHCRERRAIGIHGLDGAFAEYLVAPVANLHEIDPDIPSETAVFAEPLAAVLRPLDQIDPEEIKRAAVLGDGKIGRLTVLALNRFFPEMVLIGRHEERLAEAARSGLKTVSAGREESPGELAGRTGRFDLVIEATGRPEGLGYALALTRSQGVIIAKTTSRGESRLNLADLVVREIRLIGSRCGDVGRALAFMKKENFDPRGLIEARYPLDGFPRAFDHARRPGAGKVLVRIRSPR